MFAAAQFRRNTAVPAAVIIFLIISLFYYSITSDDKVVGFLTDDAIYLLMAEIYSPWRIHTDALLEFIRHINHFPPFYPVVMGILGVDTNHPALASRISISFLLLGFLANGYWLYRETRLPAVSIILPVVFALIPGSLILSQGLWSEFLFILLLYTSLSILSGNDITGHHWLAASLSIALLSLTRITGIAMVLAYLILLFTKRPKYYLYYALISIIPIAYWLFISHWDNSGSSYLAPLGGFLADLNFHSLAGLVIEKITAIYYSLYWLISGADGTKAPAVAACVYLLLLLTIILLTLVHRLMNKRIDAYFLLIYICAIVAWPFSSVYFISRFLYPVFPLFLFYLWEGIRTMQPGNARIPVFAAFLGAILLIALPGSLRLGRTALTSLGQDLNPYRRHRAGILSNSRQDAIRNARFAKNLFSSLDELKKFVPPDGCIYSVQTALVMLHAHRISGALPEPDLPDSKFASKTRNCNYMIAMQIVDQNNVYPPYYPLTRLAGNNKYKITPIHPDDDKHGKPVIYLITINR